MKCKKCGNEMQEHTGSGDIVCFVCPVEKPSIVNITSNVVSSVPASKPYGTKTDKKKSKK